MRDYLGIIPAVVAVLSAFVVALMANVYRDNPQVKLMLIVVAGLLGAVAIGATIYGQYLVVADRKTEQTRKAEIRERLGEFIEQGTRLMGVALMQENPVPHDEATGWLREVEAYLTDKLGKSYVARFRDSSEMFSMSYGGADEAHQSFRETIRHRVVRLQQFSQELPQ